MATVGDRGSLSNLGQTPLVLRWNEVDYPLNRLDTFTFVIDAPELARAHIKAGEPTVHDGEVRGGDEVIGVQFRIRSVDNNRILCGFFDLPISTRDRLAKLAERSKSPETDVLQSLSYDELALGKTVKAGAPTPQPRMKSSTLKKAIVSVVLAASMLATAGWVFMVVRSQATVLVSNSVMVGNYQPINAPLEGKLLDLRVAIGDRVKAGEVLASIGNPAVEHELGVVETKILRAQQDLVAYRVQSVEIVAMMKVARSALQTKRLIANAEKNRIIADLTAAKSHFVRLEGLERRGFGRLDDFERARGLRDSLTAELNSQNALIDGIVQSEEAAADNVIVSDGHVSNPMSEIRTKIALAESIVGELVATRDLVATKSKPAELVAPSAGTIFAVYRRPGEVLKHADEVIAISLDGASWATGHIPAASAADIKPGQTVEIEIPSFGVTTTGVVEGVGHRAVHGRGGYTADFRGGPLDVPIRVAISQTAERIPSGLRLNMTIRVRDHIKDLHNWMNGWAGLGVEPEDDPGSSPGTLTIKPASTEPPGLKTPAPSAAKITTSDAMSAEPETVVIWGQEPDATRRSKPLSQLDLNSR